MQWRKDIDSQMSGFRFTDASVVRSALGDWLGRVRLNGAQIMPTLAAGKNTVDLLHILFLVARFASLCECSICI